jgi:aspartate/methionine/tyrosine aminotransferase
VGPLDGASADNPYVVNSFSKYFSMTGWRLGWLVVPDALAAIVDKLAPNLFLCASALAQHSALACSCAEAMAAYESQRLTFAHRRDFLAPALQTLGLAALANPDGAFYVYADISRYAADRWNFASICRKKRASASCRDFEHAAPHRDVRFSYATDIAPLEEAVRRISG